MPEAGLHRRPRRTDPPSVSGRPAASARVTAGACLLTGPSCRRRFVLDERKTLDFLDAHQGRPGVRDVGRGVVDVSLRGWLGDGVLRVRCRPGWLFGRRVVGGGWAGVQRGGEPRQERDPEVVAEPARECADTELRLFGDAMKGEGVVQVCLEQFQDRAEVRVGAPRRRRHGRVRSSTVTAG